MSPKIKNYLEQFYWNKKVFYPALAAAALILLYVIFVRGYVVNQEVNKKEAELEKIKKVEEVKRVERMTKAQYSRISFFLTSPKRVSLAIPDYLEGNYRMKEEGNKMTLLYIKSPEFVSPFFYVKYYKKGEVKLESGEVEVRTAGDYTFVYYAYPESSYNGPDKQQFHDALGDMEAIIKDQEKLSIF